MIKIYCLVCKNVVGRRYSIRVKDLKIDNAIKGYVCRDCFNRFMDSYYHKGLFKISRFLGWAKGRDRFRD